MNTHFEKAAIILTYCWKQNECQIFMNCIFTIFKTSVLHSSNDQSPVRHFRKKSQGQQKAVFHPKEWEWCSQSLSLTTDLSYFSSAPWGWLSLIIRGYSIDPLLVTREGMRLYWWYPFKETVRRKKKNSAIFKINYCLIFLNKNIFLFQTQKAKWTQWDNMWRSYRTSCNTTTINISVL